MKGRNLFGGLTSKVLASSALVGVLSGCDGEGSELPNIFGDIEPKVVGLIYHHEEDIPEELRNAFYCYGDTGSFLSHMPILDSEELIDDADAVLFTGDALERMRNSSRYHFSPQVWGKDYITLEGDNDCSGLRPAEGKTEGFYDLMFYFPREGEERLEGLDELERDCHSRGMPMDVFVYESGKFVEVDCGEGCCD